MSGGRMSGGRMSGGRLSGGLMSGGLMSAHRHEHPIKIHKLPQMLDSFSFNSNSISNTV